MEYLLVMPGVGVVLLVMALLGILSRVASWTEKSGLDPDSRKFLGTWKGTMESPFSRPFPVTIRLAEFEFGKWCGDLEHSAPLDAEGKMLGIEVRGNTMALAQTIFRGRDRCLDGLNVLTLIDDNTMERVWVDPSTGMPRDRGQLKREA